ncbi:MAG: hypothetical protein ABFQ95_06815 [Pseudomonadota bacterium]
MLRSIRIISIAFVLSLFFPLLNAQASESEKVTYDNLPVDLRRCIVKTCLPTNDFKNWLYVSKKWRQATQEVLASVYFLPDPLNQNIENSELRFFTNLTLLNLTSNSKVTNKSVSKLTNLTHLNLTFNEKINNCLKRLNKLQVLILKCNNMVQNEHITTLTNLTELNLSCDMLLPSNPNILPCIASSSITPDAIEKLPKLTLDTVVLDKNPHREKIEEILAKRTPTKTDPDC